MKIRISDVEQTFKEIFEEEEGRVGSVETVYELSKNEDFYKLVISVHNLSISETLIIHTKFIFKTDLSKKYLVDNSFIYLYDINCIYHQIEFDNTVDLKNKIEDVIESNDFGEDLQILSDFIESPAMFLNYYMKRARITDYSVFEVKYNPKFKTVPCEKVTFDFEINVNNNYRIFLSIAKRRERDEKRDIYIFKFRFLDEHTKVESINLNNIHFLIGSEIAKLLDKKIK